MSNPAALARDPVKEKVMLVMVTLQNKYSVHVGKLDEILYTYQDIQPAFVIRIVDA